MPLGTQTLGSCAEGNWLIRYEPLTETFVKVEEGNWEPMKKAVVFSVGAAFIASSAALADVAGLAGQSSLRYYQTDGTTPADLAGAAYAVLDLYVDFSATNTEGFNNADSFLLNMFNVNVVAYNFSLFNQADVIPGGSWSPNFSLDIPGLSNPLVDSFVTIGGGVGAEAATNGTSLDPSFGAGLPADIFGVNVGWYAPPTADQGGVDTALQTWIGRFAVTGDEARAGANFDLIGDVGYNYGDSTGAFFSTGQGGNYTFVPAPGALALLGLSGLCLRRRRA